VEQSAVNLVALTPQPLPPDATIELVGLNPQPLPPDATINLVALNPQPLPPGVRSRCRPTRRSTSWR
jgi:hypothetical protein